MSASSVCSLVTTAEVSASVLTWTTPKCQRIDSGHFLNFAPDAFACSHKSHWPVNCLANFSRSTTTYYRHLSLNNDQGKSSRPDYSQALFQQGQHQLLTQSRLVFKEVSVYHKVTSFLYILQPSRWGTEDSKQPTSKSASVNFCNRHKNTEREVQLTQ